jgi:transposase-like protein
MQQHTTPRPASSSPTWEHLEAWIRERIQQVVQAMLEAKIADLLGRARHQRRQAVDAAPGYRNGYGKPCQLTLGCGTITVRRPRVGGLDARFESRTLPLFARRTREVSAPLPELYLHGLSEGDFDLALRGLLGESAPVSAATVARLKDRWQVEWDAWRTQRLDDLAVVYLWVDGIYVKAGLEREKAALLAAVAGRSDGRKVVVAVTGIQPKRRRPRTAAAAMAGNWWWP